METSATDSLEKVMHFIRRFNHPLLKIYADMGNLIAMGNDIATQLDAARGHIAAFHIKDVMPNICRDIPFEKGMVDFDRVFSEIKRIDFSGMCLLEMWANPKGNPVKEASHAYRFITEKIRHAGLGKKEYN